MNGDTNTAYGQVARSYSSYALSKLVPEQWDVSIQRHSQQIKEMYDTSSFNADEHLELEEEFVSYWKSSKQWVSSLSCPRCLGEALMLPAPEWTTMEGERPKGHLMNLNLRNTKTGEKHLQRNLSAFPNCSG